MLRRRPRDYFEIGNLRVARQDLILDTIGEIGMAFSSLRFSNGSTAMLFSGIIAALEVRLVLRGGKG